MAVEHKTKKSNRWNAWSGDLEDLRRISRIYKGLADQRGGTIADTYVPLYPLSSVNLEARRTEIREAWQAYAIVIDRDDEIRGPVADVLGALDRRSVTSIEFTQKGEHTQHDEQFSLKFSRNPDYNEDIVTLRITSGDQGWARQALAQLTEEVEKGVPRWAWWRSISGSLLSWCIVLLSTALLIIAGSRSVGVVTTVGWLPTVIGSGLTGLLVAFWSQTPRIRNWMLPPLEITSEVGSTGARRLAGLALIILGLPIGILVNILSP